jgi:hypothetical protein
MVESGPYGKGIEDAINNFIEWLGEDGEVVNVSLAMSEIGVRALIMYHEN